MVNSSTFRALALAAGIAAVPAAFAHDGDEKGQLGKVAFDNSCANKVQGDLQRAVAMLHSFWYSEGEKTFRHVLAEDPSCGIAAWGIASILMSNPLAGTGASPKGAEAAQAAIEMGRKNRAKTRRERDYLEAVAAYYEDWGNRSERVRQQNRSAAYEALAAKYPKDDEAQIFSALYIAGTQTQADQTYAAYLKAAAVLEKQFVKYPDHPGVAHYLIHSYDAPPIAKQGLVAARRYSSIAPAAPHALHMPSHIFTRVGEWEAAAATNKRSAEAAAVSNEPDEAYHASDYMTYAYLQMGMDAEAGRTIESAMKVTGYSPARGTAYYAIALMPARYVAERGAWADAMKLEPVSTKYLYPEANTHFVRALGAVRTGQVAAAEKEAEALAALHKALVAEKNSYWANETEIQRLAVAAWIAFGKGNKEEALKLMRAAADAEDRSEKHIVTPGRVVPARELLADMLMEMKEPALALREYEASQLREPNRFRGLYGAAQAAQAAGDAQKADEYFKRLVALTQKADPSRSEMVRTKASISQK